MSNQTKKTKCENCQHKHTSDSGIEYCSLRMNYPNWYSTYPIGRDMECGWYREIKNFPRENEG
jgi:hypothetical protein